GRPAGRAPLLVAGARHWRHLHRARTGLAMKLRRRDTEVFSLSFMDCICCGFGAIILLLVLTDVDQPVIIERARESLTAQLLRLQQELFVIQGDTDELRRELQGRIAELRAERSRLDRKSVVKGR